MELTRFVLMCVFWCSLTFANASINKKSTSETGDYLPIKTLQDGISEPRGRHRLQLLFPLLLRISTRLATLVPTALMTMLGVFLFVAFAKKALIVSLIALFLTISGKVKNNNEEIYIHKVDGYKEYNDEEEHYYYQWSPKYRRKPGYKTQKPYQGWRRHLRRGLPSLPHIPYHMSLHNSASFGHIVEPFRPLSETYPNYTVKRFLSKERTRVNDTAPILFPSFIEDFFESPKSSNELEESNPYI